MSATESNFATIGNVYEDGVSLIFDGEDAESKKHYKVNTSILFSPGDRVKILPDSGTYVVEYIVGPCSIIKEPLPAGGTIGQVLQKNSDADRDVAWGNLPDLTGGSTGNVLAKKSAADGDYVWTDVVKGLRDAGSSSHYIQIRYVSTTGFQIKGTDTGWITLATK